MSLSSLKPLANNRDALLLAEVAALLHDMGKCADEHIINQASDKPSNYSYGYKTAKLHRLPAGLPNINLLGETVSVQTLIKRGMPRVISDTNRPWLLRALGKCHAVAHVEKELSDQDTATKQPQQDTRLSTAYGFEGRPVTGLTALLDNLPFNDLIRRDVFVPSVRRAFEQALGDTRRPVNEVTLADWSDTVAAFYKSALAGAVLGIKPDPDHLHWRLLRVNFDVLGLYAKAVKIADLLGYQRAVEQACAAVKQLVEEEYPLGNEIYRDTSGIYFTFPDLDLPADLAQEIRRRVEEIEPELAPRIAVTAGDGATATEQLKGTLAKAHKEALEALAQPFDGQNLSTYWGKLWETVDQGKLEVCPVCRLRPMREGREACEHCEKRRGSRIEAWEKDPHRTIWIDELADTNDRVALIVGKFGLDDWLSGDLVQTMLVRAEPNNPAGCTPKNPSPARLRRVWETCRKFWTEMVQSILDALPGRERWLLEVQETDLPPQGVVCDGTLNGQPISVWRLNDELLSVSFVPKQPSVGRLHITWEDQGQKRQATYQVKDVKKPSADYLCYHPTLTLLTSPDQFLAFVPAADALEIADKIREAYETQFGKVRNRLPLFLGIVFFLRKTPLLAVMDTARRMLDVPLEEEKWEIEQDVVNGQVHFKNGIQWNVPTLMGDGQTSDEWYPYFFIIEGTTAPQHPRRFQLRRQSDNDPQKVGSVSDHYANRWLVHVNDLGGNDVVSVTPSRFAYLWLDHTARRFAFDPAQEVLLLEELPRLMHMWTALKKSDITDTGLRNVQALLEAKAATWGKDSVEFAHLVDTTLKEASLYARKDKDGHALSDIVKPEDVLSGRFFRCLELYLHILKQKVKED